MEYSFAQFSSFRLGQVEHQIFTASPSARQLVLKRGAGKVRHLHGKLRLWIQNREGFNIVQVPTGFNMADTNSKPLGGKESDT